MSKRRPRRAVTLKGSVDLAATGLAVVTLFGFLGRLWWVFDLFSHFRVQYMQAALVLIGIALWQRMHRRAVALVLLACLNYAFVLPFYFGKPASSTVKPIRAMLMNINAGNGNTEQVLAAIREAKPDLLLLEEVTPKWAAELKVLDSLYPYRLAEPREGCFGITLMAKVPLEHASVLEPGTAGIPSIIAEAYFPNGAVSIIGTHPVPPIGVEYSRHRNNQLAALPDIVRKQKFPVLLIGDLNTSPWSSYFQALERESGLKNSMKGFGFQPSWPANNRLLRIPLDHVLHSPEISIHNRITGGDVGSDHLPVIVDFSVGAIK
jgi:endonuclease/exonuclease/phosphatase (EEP) superfamily protein YafD